MTKFHDCCEIHVNHENIYSQIFGGMRYLTFKMHIRHLEQIFSIDKGVPVDLFSFWQILHITMLFIQVRFLAEAINFVSLSIPTIKYYCTL